MTDRRSSAWLTFLKAKKSVNDAIKAFNYKEAQRQLSDALFVSLSFIYLLCIKNVFLFI